MANGTVGNSLPKSETEALRRGRSIITRLQSGKLPQMVDWFDPGLLAKVGIRTVISSTLGSYTDQRLMQAATDIVDSEEELANRYNYSGETINVGGQPVATARLTANPDDPVWIDYIADLGDGFEATYAMAYLLAADELKVRGVETPLPAGKILIMGGDQVYPDASKQEYSDRLRDPYDWAFSTPEPQRKLFAIPGNHDWYDGLSAFSDLFCSARDRISRGTGAQIGGWRCHQHRSYFAIKLPHNWWLWGPDIQLADNLDDCQRDYFDLISEQTKKGDNIILCLAEPSWLRKNYDNLHEISMLARKHEAKICAVIAGDWHHYSRYASDKLGIQFITAGGGGAFAHATHGLKNSLALRWATPTEAGKSVPSTADTTAFNRLEQDVMGPEGGDFTQNPTAVPQTPASTAEDVTPEPKPITDTEAGPHGMGRRAKAVRKEDIQSLNYHCEAKSIYPPKRTSRLLCLKNLGLPFRNRPFTYLVGLIYFVFAWAFIAADPRQSPITRNMVQSISIELTTAQAELQRIEAEIAQLEQAINSPPATETDNNPALPATPERMAQDLKRLKAAKDQQASVVAETEQRRDIVRGTDTSKTRDDLQIRVMEIAGDDNLDLTSKATAILTALLGGSLLFSLDLGALIAAAELSPMLAFMLIGLWAALVYYVESDSKIAKFLIGTLHAAAHITALLFVSWLGNTTGILPRFAGGLFGISDDITRLLWNVLVALFIGGLLGGFVMGLYWTLTSTLFNMHTGDAFGALGIKNYKNFLRIKLEPGRATIYPIALDRVPGRRGWRYQLYRGEVRPAHNPQILPVKPLEPRIIEKTPIVIEADNVLP